MRYFHWQFLCLLVVTYTTGRVAVAFIPATRTTTIIIKKISNNNARRKTTTTSSFLTTPPTTSQSPLSVLQARKKNSSNNDNDNDNDKDNDSNDDDDQKANTGMGEAFRQLEALDSLGKNDDDTKGRESTVKLDEQSIAALKTEIMAQDPSLEQEIKLFKGLLEDSEQDEADLYSDVIKDMGGTPKKTTTTPSTTTTKKAEPQVSVIESQTYPRSEQEREEFLNKAIQEAIEEATKETSGRSSSGSTTGRMKGRLSESILDDEELMKEIEEIFEKGNEKLLASLKEIRQEQKALAKESAEKRSKVAMDNAAKEDQDTKERFAQAEASMEKQLSRVNQERAEVERAVADLQRVKAELDADPILKLSSNIFKPAALAGVLLFSVRSVLDFVAMAGGGIDAEAHLTAALIQGALALVCGAYLIFF